jgi:hypothetical protein
VMTITTFVVVLISTVNTAVAAVHDTRYRLDGITGRCEDEQLLTRPSSDDGACYDRVEVVQFGMKYF